MKDIHFPWLRRIYLPKNNVESVEIFCWLKMPVLEEFNIGLNYVICIDSVRKANWPNFLNLNFLKFRRALQCASRSTPQGRSTPATLQTARRVISMKVIKDTLRQNIADAINAA